MEVVQEFLYRIFAVLIFCLAIGVLMANITVVNKMSGVAKEAVVEDRNMYEAADNVVQDIDILTCDEVIAYVISGIEYDVEIDGVLLNILNFDKSNFNYAFISNDYYKRSYEYDSEGTVKAVVFTSVIKS